MEHKALLEIGRILNSNSIRWALGASYALYFYGLVDKARDIDIIVDEKDIHKAIELLSKVAAIENEPPKGKYLTEFFYYFTYENSEIDIISNFKIKHESGEYSYNFDEGAIVDSVTIDNVDIPLVAMEDWYVLYFVMRNKKGREDLIENEFRNKTIKNRNLLKRALNQELPEDVRSRIENILTN